jgi:hypothetical protein
MNLSERSLAVSVILAESWLLHMGGTAEFGWGPDGPRGTGRA